MRLLKPGAKKNLHKVFHILSEESRKDEDIGSGIAEINPYEFWIGVLWLS